MNTLRSVVGPETGVLCADGLQHSTTSLGPKSRSMDGVGRDCLQHTLARIPCHAPCGTTGFSTSSPGFPRFSLLPSPFSLLWGSFAKVSFARPDDS